MNFRDAVQKSRVLSTEQKQDLLENPEELPETYRVTVTKLLTTFDENSRFREAHVRQKLEESLAAFTKQLEDEGVDEIIKAQLLSQARQQIAQFFPV